MGVLGNTLSSSNHDSPIGAFLEPIDKIANPMSWVTGGKWAKWENEDLPDATNRALAPITQGIGSIDQKINPLRRIGAVNNVMNTLEAKPGDAIGLAVGSFFTGGALDGALAGSAGAGGAAAASAGATGALGAADAGTAAAIGAGAADAGSAAALGAGVADAGATAGTLGAGAADAGVAAGTAGDTIGMGSAADAIGTLGGTTGDSVGMGTAATNANDFGLSSQLTTVNGVENGSFSPLAANTALPASGPVGAGGGSSMGSATWGAQLGKYSKALTAGSTAANLMNNSMSNQQTAQIPRAAAAGNRVASGSGMPAPLPMVSNPGRSMMPMPGANALPTSSNAYQTLLNNMLANETNPMQGLSSSSMPGAGGSMLPSVIIPGTY